MKLKAGVKLVVGGKLINVKQLKVESCLLYLEETWLPSDLWDILMICSKNKSVFEGRGETLKGFLF